MQLASIEARRFNHEYIGPEHILLGLVKESSGLAGVVLRNVMGIELQRVRLEVEKIVQSEPGFPIEGTLPLTPKAKQLIEFAVEEARNLKHYYVGTEHLLLGLTREEESVAAHVLLNVGLKLEDVRERVNQHLPGKCLKPVGKSERPDPEAELQDLPEEVRKAVKELDAEIDRLQFEKEEAVAMQDFEKAAWLHDEERKLRKKREQLIREWREKS
jgi:ATP-dependent Clp protease ATP-binding subunit ClpA